MYAAGSANLSGDNDWEYFVWGSDVLFGGTESLAHNGRVFEADEPGGLNLYASYPFLQIGPPALLLASLLKLLGPGDGIYTAQAVCQALGVLAVVALDRCYDDGSRAHRLKVVLGGALLMVVWGSLTHFTHLDDAMTLSALLGAVWMLSRRRSVSAGLLLGLAAAAKPWGVVGIGLVLALEKRPDRLRAAGTAALVCLVFWGPFLLTDLSTARLGDVQVRVFTSSVPALLGLESVASGEAIRITQLLGGAVVVAALSLAGRPHLALAAAFALRLLLEPAAYAYYATALVAGALVLDIGNKEARLPWATLICGVVWLGLFEVDDPTARGLLRLLTYAGVLTTCLALAARRGATSAERMAAT